MATFRLGDVWVSFAVRKDVADNVDADWIESKGMIANVRAGG